MLAYNKNTNNNTHRVVQTKIEQNHIKEEIIVLDKLGWDHYNVLSSKLTIFFLEPKDSK